MKYVSMLESFGLTIVWRFNVDGQCELRNLRGNEKWKILSKIYEKDDNFLSGIFIDFPDIKKVNKVK